MPDDQETYTYRNGEKVPLEKAPDQFVEDVVTVVGVCIK